LGISESYYLIEEVTIYDLDGIHLRSSVRAIQKDSVDFSTQKNQDFVGYFSKLVELAKKTDSKINPLSNYNDFLGVDNESEQEIDTDETVLGEIITETSSYSQIVFYVQIDGTASEALTATLKARYNEVDNKQTVKRFTAAHKDQIVFVGLIDGIGAGIQKIDFVISVDAGTLTIAIGEFNAHIIVKNAAETEQEWVDYAPDITLTTLTVPTMPTVAEGTGTDSDTPQSITPTTLTAPTMPTVAEGAETDI